MGMGMRPNMGPRPPGMGGMGGPPGKNSTVSLYQLFNWIHCKCSNCNFH